MTDNKNQFSHMSQFSIIRELPASKSEFISKKTERSPQHQQQKTSELKFKIEPIGIQPEDDDDLETCPSRTRSSWPHQITPWWKPTDGFEKPPYSYATLIAHAILTSKDGRLTLSDIYKWISEAYPYYKRGQKGWQNSIRHNLSLNKKWFIKVDRRPTQAHPGKGGYWTLQLNMEKIFVDNLSQAGGHSRRHHDMGMYGSLATQQYYSGSSASSDHSNQLDDDLNSLSLCPNIHITRPEDFEAKKTKSSNSNVISAPRFRNMTPQEKSSMASSNDAVVPPPNTKFSNFTIRFNDSDPNGKRRKSNDPPRPTPKCGKRRNPREPGSSTAEEEDSAVDVGSYSDAHTSKKRKSTTTTKESIDTISASPIYPLAFPEMLHNRTRPSDLIGTLRATGSNDLLGLNDDELWMYDECKQITDTNNMLLTSEYPLLFDVEAQNILNGLQSAAAPTPVAQHPDMKTVNLQYDSIEKNIHYPNMFNMGEFSDPNSNLFIPDLNTYNLDQYVDFGSHLLMDDSNQQQPSDLLLQDETLDTYWPENSSACFVPFDTTNNSTTMPY